MHYFLSDSGTKSGTHEDDPSKEINSKHDCDTRITMRNYHQKSKLF